MRNPLVDHYDTCTIPLCHPDHRYPEPLFLKGHSGGDGFCDCIGLIIGALKRCGISWKEIHGSNWAARYKMIGLHKVSRASDLMLGDIVFKAYEPHTSGWKLPDRYKGDPDQKDYFHVGVVTQVSPLKITHMTSPTIKVDTKIGKWSYAGILKYINEKGDEKPMTAIIVSDDGNPVKLRPTASTSQPYVEKIPVGTTVSVLEKGEEWSKVTALGKTGYIMTKFLNQQFSQSESASAGNHFSLSENGERQGVNQDGDYVSLQLPRETALLLRDKLNVVL